ncbi:MAG: sensor histidine kinase [Steroidobacteraceae bacterium]
MPLCYGASWRRNVVFSMTHGDRIRREPGDRDTVLARIGHELRTPLKLMGMPGPLNEDQDRQLRTVQSSARRRLALVNDLLELMKVAAGERERVIEPVDCGDVLREVEEIVRPEAEQRGARLTLSQPDAGAIVDTDRRALRQILVGLALAVVRLADRSAVAFEFRRTEGSSIAFRIDHDGPGIATAERAGFYEPFMRFDRPATHPGSALELHLCRKLAAWLGGRVAIEDAPQGMRLVFELPG